MARSDNAVFRRSDLGYWQGIARGGDWDDNLLAIPEYSFGVDVTGMECILSTEHSEMCWCNYYPALDLLHWESNRTALRELHQHLLQYS